MKRVAQSAESGSIVISALEGESMRSQRGCRLAPTWSGQEWPDQLRNREIGAHPESGAFAASRERSRALSSSVSGGVAQLELYKIPTRGIVHGGPEVCSSRTWELKGRI